MGPRNQSDAIAILGYLFLGGDTPGCRESADINNDGEINITDPISLLGYLFLGGPGPAEPGLPPAACGIDRSPGDLGCLACEHCP